MAWRRIDDQFDVHRKTRALAALGRVRCGAALALWTLGGCQASRDSGGVVDSVYVESAPVVRPERAASDLVAVGLWTETEGGFVFHNDSRYNPSSEEKAEKRRGKHARQARWRAKVRRGVDASTASTVDGAPVPSRPVPSPTPLTPVPPEPPKAEQIAELEGRYPPSVVAEARAGCALTRDRKKMGDGPWLKTLRKLAEYPRDASLNAMEVFADRYADGDRGEKYMIGIARNYRPDDRQEEGPPVKPDMTYSESVAAARADAAAHNTKLDKKFGRGSTG